MFTKIRNRVEGDQGFTLIELLVVILIIGILAAIAIPSFLNQRQKGQDACAKSMVRTMQTAMETEFVDANSYAGGDMARLSQIENQITSVAPCGGTSTATVGLTGAASTCAGTPDGAGFAVCSLSVSGQRFSIVRAAGGAISRLCTPARTGGCLVGGIW